MIANPDIEKYYDEKDRQEMLRHRDVLLAIASITTTKEGLQFFSYLLENLEVCNLPDKSKTGEELHEHLGFLRAGNSIYKLLCEADSETAASLMAKIERKRYEEQLELYRIKTGINTSSGDADG